MGIEKHNVDYLHGRYRCLCCDFLTLRSRSDCEICEVCFWEDDGFDDVAGPNHQTLAQGRAVYRCYGASAMEMMPHVRPPKPFELAERERWHLAGKPSHVAQ